MNRTRWCFSVLLVTVVLLLASGVGADESDPLPAPKGTPRERAINTYNEGVTYPTMTIDGAALRGGATILRRRITGMSCT